MCIRGILFDKDDTIIDLAAFWKDPICKAANYVTVQAKGYVDPSLYRDLVRTAGFSDDYIIPESPVVAGTNRDILEDWHAVLLAHGISLSKERYTDFDQYLEWACLRYGEVKARGDFYALLKALHERGFTLGIATSDNYAPTLHCLQVLGLDQFFDIILSADRVEHPKPHPESAKTFCDRFLFTPSEVAMVGDSVNDMRFAKNSGLMGIFFQPNGWDDPLPPGAQICVQDITQILNCIPLKK